MGIQKARSPYLAFLDSDDVWVPEKLEIQINQMKAHSEFFLSHTEELWYKGSRRIKPLKIHRKKHGDIFQWSLKLCSISMSTVILKKELVKDIGLFDEKLEVCEDYDYWLRVTAQYPVLLIDKPLTIKQGGHFDQQSQKYFGLDKFRIYAIKKLINSNKLNKEQRELAMKELKKKCRIYGQGCLKYHKKEEGKYYLNLANGANGVRPPISNWARKLKEIDDIIANQLKIIRGLNKRKEIRRLVFELFKKYNYNKIGFLNIPEIQKYIHKKQFNYSYLKSILLKLRYPDSHGTGNLDDKRVYLPDLKPLPVKKQYIYRGYFKPRSIYIEESQMKNEMVKAVLERFSNIKPVYIDKLKNVDIPVEEYSDTLGKDKLFLVEENFDIFKKCPCTRNVFGCHYYILNIGFGCVYDCTYCYLQHYANFPGIIMPVNIKQMLEKLKKILGKHKKVLRIGTGEFTDSLILDDIIPYTKYLINFFRNQKHYLELKTKSINIENILSIKPSSNIVISWSLNTPSRIKKEEYYTPSLKERLKAAGQVIRKGYNVGFHFDPIIFYDNWEKEYKETVEEMFEHARGHIQWISLGMLRFNRELKPIIEQRFPEQEILNGELLIDPVDKKMRYPEYLRIEIFRKMVQWIQQYDKQVVIYLCMEPEHVWQKVFNKQSFVPERTLSIIKTIFS